MSLAAMLINVNHAVHEDREHAVNGVGMDRLGTFLANVFTSGLLGCLLRSEFLASPGVEARGVSIDHGIIFHKGFADRLGQKGESARIGHHEDDNLLVPVRASVRRAGSVRRRTSSDAVNLPSTLNLFVERRSE